MTLFFQVLKKYEQELAELFILSDVQIKEDASVETITVVVDHADGENAQGAGDGFQN